MKAIELVRPGGLDNLKVCERDKRDPGPGEIQVRVRASSLNFHDYAVVSGMIPMSEERIPMSDGAGVVTAVGDGVTAFEEGDEVVSTFFPYWLGGADMTTSMVTTSLPLLTISRLSLGPMKQLSCGLSTTSLPPAFTVSSPQSTT